MSKYIVIDNDALLFDTMFSHRLVTITGSAQIKGSGKANINNKKVCVLGDEKKISLDAVYIAPGFPIPGKGKVTISLLNADQQAIWCLSGQPVILVGQKFIASFTPTDLAKSPPPAQTPDIPAPTLGSGKFINSQMLVTVG
ncbi:hypothetical protein Xmau_03545 [Xenorhabdus mauleonii]|uniref:Uncharacterized protein n=1 Tax=Xenorhabdus mauleonii TaxID=351675 RepID=A0A1I3WUM1_9GAMM|nr:hypothetical protein [Xenorhabdus mauleonii]PHM38160.1 hypothetical protein Xmau_03545 [Xenorhabdus mauleonii]SFK10849.1 hypothetical protein SAMN05421680_12931 [Xenorhabdus mauleonii]